MRGVTKLILPVLLGVASAQQLIVEVVYSVDCTRKTKDGDVISVDYTGTLTDGTEFDSSSSPTDTSAASPSASL